METRGKVLILGATGGIGGETARRLIQKKWDVRALKRGLHGSEQRDDIQWIGATFSTRTKSPRRRQAVARSFTPSIRPATETGSIWCCLCCATRSTQQNEPAP